MATLRTKDEAFTWEGTGGASANWEEEISAGVWGAHVGMPTAADDVVMHGSHAVTIKGTVACRSVVTEAGFTGELKQPTGTTLEVGTSTAPPGNKAWNWIAGTYAPAGSATIKFVQDHATTVTIHNGGQVPRTIVMAGKKEGVLGVGAGIELTDDLNGVNELLLESGSIKTGANQTWSKFNGGSVTKEREIRINHKVVLTGSNVAAWTSGTSTGFNHASQGAAEIIELTGKESTVKEAVGKFSTLILTGDKNEIAAASTEVDTLEIAEGKTLFVKKGITLFIGTPGSIVSKGKAGSLAAIESNEAGKPFKLKHVGGGALTTSNLKVKDCTAEGFTLQVNTVAENLGGNTGVKFATAIGLGAALSKSTGTLAPTVRTPVPLAVAVSTTTATAAVHGTPKLTMKATSSSAASMKVVVQTRIPLAVAAATSAATFVFRAVPRFTLISTSTSSASLLATAATLVRLTVASSESHGSAALTTKTRAGLASASSGSAASLAPRAPASVKPNAASSTSAASLRLTAAPTVALAVGASTSRAQLGFSAQTFLTLSASALSGATLRPTVRTPVPLAGAKATSTATCRVEAGIRGAIKLNSASAQSAASLAARGAPHLNIAGASQSAARMTIGVAPHLALGAAMSNSTASAAARAPIVISPSSAASATQASITLRVGIVTALVPARAHSGGALSMSVPTRVRLIVARATSEAECAARTRVVLALTPSVAVSAAQAHPHVHEGPSVARTRLSLVYEASTTLVPR